MPTRAAWGSTRTRRPSASSSWTMPLSAAWAFPPSSPRATGPTSPGNDLLQYWEEDPATAIALLYLETFGNPRRFARVARRVARKKPILCVKSARSRAGRHAARAHIAASAQRDTEVDVLFRQAGVIRANTLDEMFDVAVLLAHQPLPRGNHVAIVSNSGGVVTICADACEAGGLEVASSDAVDLGALATAEAFEKSVRGCPFPGRGGRPHRHLRLRGRVRPHRRGQGHPAGHRGGRGHERRTQARPPLPHGNPGRRGAHLDHPRRGRPRDRIFPSYRFPESAAFALGRAAQYAAFRRQPAGKLLWYEDAKPAAARRRLEAALQRAGGPGRTRLDRRRGGQGPALRFRHLLGRPERQRRVRRGLPPAPPGAIRPPLRSRHRTAVRGAPPRRAHHALSTTRTPGRWWRPSA